MSVERTADRLAKAMIPGIMVGFEAEMRKALEGKMKPIVEKVVEGIMERTSVALEHELSVDDMSQKIAFEWFFQE